MLVLSRKPVEEIVIGEGVNQVVLTVVDVLGNRVRLGLEAQTNIKIHRREIYDEIKDNAREAS